MSQQAAVSGERQKKDDGATLLENLDKDFYATDVDIIRHVLNKFPSSMEGIDSRYLQEEEAKYMRTLELVDQQICSTVIKNYETFVRGMQMVQEYGSELHATVHMCRTVRRRLAKSREASADNLRMLVMYKKQQNLKIAYEYASEIHKLWNMQNRFNALLQQNNFIDAVHTMTAQRNRIDECLRKRKDYEVVAMFDSLYPAQNIETIERKLDRALEMCCRSFQSENYAMVLQAYKLMNPIYDVSDKITRYYIELIDRMTQEVVNSFALRTRAGQQKPEAVMQMKFRDVCKMISEGDYLICAMNICDVLSDLLYNYNRMLLWHKKNQEAYFLKQVEEAQQIESNQQQQQQQQSESNKTTTDDTSTKQQSYLFNFEEQRVILESFRKTIWDMMQSKVGNFLNSLNYTQFKFSRFLQLLHAISMFIELGEKVYPSSSNQLLRNFLRAKSQSYFSTFHKESLDVIRMVLDNESWRKLELSNFSYTDIKELHVRSPPPELLQLHAANVREFLDCNEDEAETENPFRKINSDGEFLFIVNPPPEAAAAIETSNAAVISTLTESTAATTTATDEAEETEQQKQLVAASAAAAAAEPKSLTSSVINIARFIGKYLNVMETVQPVAIDAFFGYSVLYQFYLYTVFGHFANTSSNKEPLIPELDTQISNQLRSYFVKARESLHKSMIRDSDLANNKLPNVHVEEPNQPQAANGSNTNSPSPTTTGAENAVSKASNTLRALVSNASSSPTATPSSPAAPSTTGSSSVNSNTTGASNSNASSNTGSTTTAVGFRAAKLTAALSNDLANPQKLFGIQERCTAVESLSFLLDLLRLLVPRIKESLDTLPAGFLEQYVTEAEEATREVRAIVYRRAAQLLMPSLESYPQLIERNKYDIQMVQENNKYVAVILKDYRELSERITHPAVGLSQQSIDGLWRAVIQCTLEALVEGFSRVKKCNNEGRALMMLDFKTLLSGIEKLTAIRPLPNTEYVNAYIRGFFIPESDIIAWASAHREYTTKQLTNLVQCAYPNAAKNLLKNFN